MAERRGKSPLMKKATHGRASATKGKRAAPKRTAAVKAMAETPAAAPAATPDTMAKTPAAAPAATPAPIPEHTEAPAEAH